MVNLFIKNIFFFLILLKLYRNILPLLDNFCLHPAKTLRIGSHISLNHSNIDLEKLNNLSCRSARYKEGTSNSSIHMKVTVETSTTWKSELSPCKSIEFGEEKFHPKSTSKFPKDTNKRRKNYLLSLGSSYMK